LIIDGDKNEPKAGAANKSRFTEPQILAILKQGESGVPVPDLCREHGIPGYSRMTKKLMIERLIAKGVDAPRIPLEALSKAELIEALRDMIKHERHAD
jgi:hypothetical protein